jgi:hypothetical protein
MDDHKVNIVIRRILGIVVSHCLASYIVLFGMMIEIIIRFGTDVIIDQKLNLVIWLAPVTMVLVPILYATTKTSGYFIIPAIICALYIGLFIVAYRWFSRHSTTVLAGFARMLDLILLLWIPAAIIGFFSIIPVPRFIYLTLILVTVARLPFQLANLIKFSTKSGNSDNGAKERTGMVPPQE